MTTLRPVRDSLVEALAQAREATARLPEPATPADAVERALALDLMEVALLAVADLQDLEVAFEQTQAILETAMANVIVSHAMSLTDGDGAQAYGIAIRTLGGMTLRCRRQLHDGGHAVAVRRPIVFPKGGRA